MPPPCCRCHSSPYCRPLLHLLRPITTSPHQYARSHPSAGGVKGRGGDKSGKINKPLSGTLRLRTRKFLTPRLIEGMDCRPLRPPLYCRPYLHGPPVPSEPAQPGNLKPVQNPEASRITASSCCCTLVGMHASAV